jgi:hypothetical protein
MNLQHPRLHLPSAALGCLGLLGLEALLGPRAVPRSPGEAEGAPHWQSLVRIVEGTPYTVPEGSALLLQSAGFYTREGLSGGAPVAIEVNGQLELLLDPTNGGHLIAPGWMLPPGARVAVEMIGEDRTGLAFGQLLPAR